MWKQPLSETPLLIPATMLAAGILCGSYLPLWIASIGLLAVAAAMLIKNTIAVAWVTVFFTGFSLAYLLVPRADDTAFNTIDALYYQGEVEKLCSSDKGTSIRMNVDRCGTDTNNLRKCSPQTVAVTVTEFEPDIFSGDIVRIFGTMSKITRRRDLPDEISPDDYTLRNGIFYRCFAGDSIQIIEKCTGLQSTMIKVRKRLTERLYASDITPGAKSFLAATLLGDSGMLDDSIRQTFSRAGIAHVLALSGLHVGLIAMLISVGLYPLTLTRWRKGVGIATVALLWGYALMTGMGASVMRAVTMATVYFAARILQRRYSALNAMCFAAMAILTVDPKSIFSISFQLTFAAVGAIILFSEQLIFVSQRHRIGYAVNSFFAVTVSAMIGTGVMSIVYFKSLPVYFLLSNAVVALLFPALMCCGAVAIGVSAGGWNWDWLNIAIDSIYNIISEVASWVTTLPGVDLGHVYFPEWSAWIMVPAIMLTGISIHWKLRGTLYCGIGGIIATFIAVSIAPAPEDNDMVWIVNGGDSTHALVVQKGDATIRMYTTTNATRVDEAVDDALGRYETFMIKRRKSRISGKSIRDSLLRIDTQRGQLVIAGDNIEKPVDGHTTFLVVTQSTKANYDKTLDNVTPDTVIIAGDVEKRRLKRWKSACEKRGVATVTLRDTTFHLPL